MGSSCLFSNIINTYVVIIKWSVYLVENLFQFCIHYLPHDIVGFPFTITVYRQIKVDFFRYKLSAFYTNLNKYFDSVFSVQLKFVV